ncbi:ABC transporter permease [Sphingomonas sp. RT2P30]|uniref:ABC transporter permease n=1 Tax=Parasphingomonas halimpatiens TaxID=3096162 RepID=UPI002FCAF2E7
MRLAGAAGSLGRLLLGLWAVVTASFLCLYVLPGEPARMILGPQASQASVDQFRADYGLNRPVGDQYLHYVSRLAALDLGTSYSRRQPVAAVVAGRLGATLLLAGAALALALLTGIALPLVLISRRAEAVGGAFGFVLQAVAFIPPYLLALAILLLATTVTNLAPVLFDPSSPLTWFLAALALAAYPAALLFQVFVQAMSKDLRSDYARRAAACGFSHSDVVLREVVRNAMSPPLAAIANTAAYFFTSALFVEAVFGIPGLGRLAQDAVRVKDLSLLNGVCIAYCLLVGLSALLLDAVPRLLRPSGGSHR